MKNITLKAIFVFVGFLLIWHFAWIVSAFTLMNNSPEQYPIVIKSALTIWFIGVFISVLFMWIFVNPIEKNFKKIKELSNEKLLKITKRSMNVNLLGLVVYAIIWLSLTIVMNLYLQTQFGNIAASSIYVGGIAGFIACPFMVFGGFSLFFSPINRAFTNECNNRKLVVNALPVNVFNKLFLTSGGSIVGIAVWIGGFAYYTGINQMIEEAKSDHHNLREVITKNILIKNDTINRYDKDLINQIHQIQLKENDTILLLNKDLNVIKKDSLESINSKFSGNYSQLINNTEKDTTFYCNIKQCVLSYGNFDNEYNILLINNISHNTSRMFVFWIWFIVFLFVGFLVTLINSFTISKWMNKTLTNLKNLFGLLEKSDLSSDATKDSEDELSAISDKYNIFIASIRQLVKLMQITASTVSGSSNQLSAMSQQLSQGANEQAASVEEVSSSIEEMLASISQNNDNTQVSLKLSETLTVDIKKVDKLFNATLGAMKDIKEKVEIINDIAEKTDLLAINAAVEAARAGSYGKGFSIVADEIRVLAENSSKAAKFIDELSDNSYKTAVDTGKQLNEAIGNINKIIQLINEIAATSREQKTGATEIDASTQQMVSITNQNSSTAEELSAGAEELNTQAEKLKEQLQNFKLKSVEKKKKQIDLLQKIAEKLEIPLDNDDEEYYYNSESVQDFIEENKNKLEKKGVNINLKDGNNDKSDDEFEDF